VAVRGIHTDQNCWPPSDVVDLTVYGVWVNDPMPNGVGQNWYITADAFTTNYWKPISVPGVLRENNYVCVVEPPQDFDESVFDQVDVSVQFGTVSGKPSEKVVGVLKQGSLLSSQVGLSDMWGSLKEQVVVDAARCQVAAVLENSPELGLLFYGLSAERPWFDGSCWQVSFVGSACDVVAFLDGSDFALQKFLLK
jgi:hypothetical protein